MVQSKCSIGEEKLGVFVAENAILDLVEWWKSTQAPLSYSNLSITEVISRALCAIGVMREDETLIAREVEKDWHQDSEEAFTSIIKFEIESLERIRTVHIACYAVITPPLTGLDISDRITQWRTRIDSLRSYQVNIPKWYLIWRGTIYAEHPSHSLMEYLSEPDLEPADIEELAKDVWQIFRGLSELAFNPLSIRYSLRTDSFRVFYTGMGFDLGVSNSLSIDEPINEFEEETLPFTPMLFQETYHRIKRQNQA